MDYNFLKIEKEIYDLWTKIDAFKSEEKSTKSPFCVVLPPPKLTGVLHLGHALNHTIQDVFTRLKRMQGFNVLLLPGFDEGGLAFQTVIEEKLLSEGKNKFDLGRKKFFEVALGYREKYQNDVINQMKRLGVSCDFNRMVFSLDESFKKAVYRAFKIFFDKGYLTKETTLVHWSVRLRTAISEEEVVYRKVNEKLWYIDFLLEDNSTILTSATVRPELLCAVTALLIHPKDERYNSFIGLSATIPIINKKVPIIADKRVDRKFGSGVLQLTPGHDFRDHLIAEKQDIDIVSLMEKDGVFNKNAGPYCGKHIDDVRNIILEDLESLEAIRKKEDFNHLVGYCSRTGERAEPVLSEQWFLNAESFIVDASRAVESGTIMFYPDSWTSNYLSWVGQRRKWCISRQIWWGHQVPVWYCNSCNHLMVAEKTPVVCESCGEKNLHQDENVLDTWFTTSLWPLASLGWPQSSELFKTFYPNNMVVTGPDYVFLWVTRMIMMGIALSGDVPFRKVFVHGLVKETQSEKMSKSKKSDFDVNELFNKNGADVLRLSLLLRGNMHQDFTFDLSILNRSKKIIHKILNVSYFIQQCESKNSNDAFDEELSIGYMSIYDRWMISCIHKLIIELESDFEHFRCHEACEKIIHCLEVKFGQWYLGFYKATFEKMSSKDQLTSYQVMRQCFVQLLSIVHPFIPHVSEYIYRDILKCNDLLVKYKFPNRYDQRKWWKLSSRTIDREVEFIRQVVIYLRQYPSEFPEETSFSGELFLVPSDDDLQKIIGQNKEILQVLTGFSEIQVVNQIEDELIFAADFFPFDKIQFIKIYAKLSNFDKTKEKNRIQNIIIELDKKIQFLDEKLSNNAFIENASEQLIQSIEYQIKITQQAVEFYYDRLNFF